MSAKTILTAFGIFLLLFVCLINAKMLESNEAHSVRVKANDPTVRVQVR